MDAIPIDPDRFMGYVTKGLNGIVEYAIDKHVRGNAPRAGKKCARDPWITIGSETLREDKALARIIDGVRADFDASMGPFVEPSGRVRADVRNVFVAFSSNARAIGCDLAPADPLMQDVEARPDALERVRLQVARYLYLESLRAASSQK